MSETHYSLKEMETLWWARLISSRNRMSETHYSLKEVILMHINEVKEDAMFIECLSTVGIVKFVVFFLLEF